MGDSTAVSDDSDLDHRESGCDGGSDWIVKWVVHVDGSDAGGFAHVVVSVEDCRTQLTDRCDNIPVHHADRRNDRDDPRDMMRSDLPLRLPLGYGCVP